MRRKFKWIKFADCDLHDPFFNSLKQDYPEFIQWFVKKSRSGESAFVYKDEKGICAFLYLKEEEEPIKLADQILPSNSVFPKLSPGCVRRYVGCYVSFLLGDVEK
jgi:hypothetical protein